jgi:hypothetical protein
LRKATINFVMSVRLSACNNSAQSGNFFRKFVVKIQVSLTSDKHKGYFTWRQIKYFWSYCVHFLLEWMFQISCREN